MPTRRTDDMPHLIGDIYDCGLEPTNWPHVLEQLAGLFGASSANLADENLTMPTGTIVSFGSDPAWAQPYAEYYVSRNILWHHWRRMPGVNIMTDRLVLPRDEFRQSEFYNDFLRPLGADEIAASIALRGPETATVLILWRPERFGAWEKEDVDLLSTLTPHFRRAILTNRRLGELKVVRDSFAEILNRLGDGVILVSADARPRFANRTAEALLADRTNIHVDNRRLATTRLSDTAKLRRLIAAAANQGEGASLVIAREGRPSLILLVMPLKAGKAGVVWKEAGALVLIKDLEQTDVPTLGAFRNYFSLTPAEMALCHEVGRGDGVAAAASRLGISYATARTHLLRIFQKTATNRQTELIELMRRWNEGPNVADGLQRTGSVIQTPPVLAARGKAGHSRYPRLSSQAGQRRPQAN